MTSNEYFENLLDRISLKINDDERKFIEDKQNKLREALRKKLTLKDDFLTGSYRRHTIIKPKKETEKFDIDVFIAFSNEEYGEKELSQLHDLVATALRAIKDKDLALGIARIDTSQRRSIGVEFGNNFQIDIVPAIEIEKDKLYKIFDKKTFKAVKSNPKLHGELLTTANDIAGGKLIPIVKMLKSWKREKCDYVKSFHLELLTTEILGNAEIESFAEGIAIFFAKAEEKLQNQCLKDPANNTYYIDAYLDEDGTRQQLLNLVSEETGVAQKAIKSERSKNEEAAVEGWEKIFGEGLEKYVRNDSQPFKPHRPWSTGYLQMKR